MKRLLPMILICILLASCLVFLASAKEGTEGDELQVLQPEQLEIQLGAELAGAQFSLKTDTGMYPGTVVADANGTLKLEIGGSSSYVLTRLDAASAAPAAAVLTDDPDQPVSEMSAGETETAVPEETVPAEPAQQDNTIPTMHIILFSGGTVLCIAFLVISFVFKRRRARDYYEEDEEG